MERILVVVRVFPPMDDGISGIGPRSPRCLELNILAQSAAKGESTPVAGPSAEGISRAGRSGRSNGHTRRRNKGRLDITAALGVIGDPVTVLDLRIEGDVGFSESDRFDAVGQSRLGVPAGNGLIGIDREGDVGRDGITGRSFLGRIDPASGIHKENIVDLRKISVEVYLAVGGHCLCAESGEIGAAALALAPSKEFMPFLGRSCRSIQRIAGLDHLCVNQRTLHIKTIGLVGAAVRSRINDASDCGSSRYVQGITRRGAAVREHARRQHRKHHQECQKGAAQPLPTLFHLLSSSPYFSS